MLALYLVDTSCLPYVWWSVQFPQNFACCPSKIRISFQMPVTVITLLALPARAVAPLPPVVPDGATLAIAGSDLGCALKEIYKLSSA